MDIGVTEIIDAVLRSRKYRHVCRATVARIAADQAARSGSVAEALKRTKRKLHQICAAYLEGWSFDRAKAILELLPEGATLEQARPLCRRILAMHASTRERAGELERFYEPVFAVTGPVASVLDVGCGLHPFALPWMRLPVPVRYRAWDIEGQMVDLLNAFFRRLGAAGLAECRDIVTETPEERADVAFLMKMLPCLSQQDCPDQCELLARIPARFLVVSFPVRSLGGRRKDMRRTYREEMAAILGKTHWPAELVRRSDELVFVVDKGSG